MMSIEDEEDFVIYGTPLEREEDLAPSKHKQAQVQGTLRNASPWNQEVFDESGRRRFHGAFTGGFSAGYYNTVGSQEGWAPQSFTSSRKKRAELQQKSAYDFMDEDEKAEHDYTNLGAVSEFDTFGLTAAEVARQEAAREVQKRPSIIPGLPPDEIIVPVSDSIGFKLLLKMGWRHGRGIGPTQIAASSEIRRQGRKAMLALAQHYEGDSSKEHIHDVDISSGLTHTIESKGGVTEEAEILPRNTPIYVIHPKNDRHGFGFDPYKDAPEFQERKQLHLGEDLDTKSGRWAKQHDIVSKPSLFRPNMGRMGSGFGIGAMEELDEEDEDIYAPGAGMEIVVSDEEVYTSSSKRNQEQLRSDTKGMALPGFTPALIPELKLKWFPPPSVPSDFVAVHKFTDSLESERFSSRPMPTRVGPPEDIELCKMIEGLARIVARSGSKLEKFYMDKKTEDPMFAFLFGGNGHAYYEWRRWEEQTMMTNEGNGQSLSQRTIAGKTLDSVQRGKVLGEIPLDCRAAPSIAPEDRARLQSALSSTFTRPTDKVDITLPQSEIFKENAGKQARFEQFLKDRFQGGLRAFGQSSLTELERAQEALEFEAACNTLQNLRSSVSVLDASTELQKQNLQSIMSNRFASQTSEEELGGSHTGKMTERYPKREEQPWRPILLLCKRFNLSDPYLGKPLPLPKPRSRTDSFILLSNQTVTGVKTSDTTEKQDQFPPMSQIGDVAVSVEQDVPPFGRNEDPTHEASVQVFEKPVDLYKAIFSDDSEEESTDFYGESKHEDKTGEAAQAALNRLEAGDFLASLGKELGLKVPPQEPRHIRRAKETVVLPEAAQPSVRDVADVARMPLEYSSAVKYEQLSQQISESLSVHESMQEPTASMLQHNYADEKSQKSEDRIGKSLSEAPLNSEETSSEDDSDSYDNERQERKRKKKDRKGSDRHKKRIHKHHKERKRGKHHHNVSHKHEHSGDRKHHKSRYSDKTR